MMFRAARGQFRASTIAMTLSLVAMAGACSGDGDGDGGTNVDDKGVGQEGPKDDYGLPPLPSTPPGLTPPPDVAVIRPETPPFIPSGPDVPTIRAVQSGRWDDPATWEQNRVPTNGDIVGIPRDKRVELASATASLRGLWIDGSLTFAADADVSLTSRFAILTGTLQAGTATQPYTKRAVVTMTGSDPQHDVLGMGTKGIIVMTGGLLKLHGELRLAWTQLTANADVGATTMILKDDASTWRAGDKLALAPGGWDPREAEVVEVASVAGKVVSFKEPLRFPRTAQLKTIEGRTLDERPAVGLTTRNIVIRGADDADDIGLGGHVMVMSGGNAQVSGVELTKAGQRGKAGRYPFHWHLVGEREGNYLWSAAIHDTFQRACVIHSTHNVALDGNVAYNISNHAFVWAEDGDEHGNRLTRNLGILTKIPTPQPDAFAFKINNPVQGNSSQGELRSGTFWGRSFDRIVMRANVAAGVVDGTGFFLDLFSPRPHADDEGGALVFDSNTAYATLKVVDAGNQINYPEATSGHGLMVTTGTSGKHEHVLTRYTGYHNTSSAWIEDRSTRLKDSIVADSRNGVMIVRGSLEGSVVVGNSGHPITADKDSFGIRVAGSNHGGQRSAVVVDNAVVDFPGTGFAHLLDNISPETKVSGLRFFNTPKRALFGFPSKFDFATPPNFALDDLDGSVSGLPASRITMWDSPLIGSSCTEKKDLAIYACPASESLLLRSNTPLTLVEESGIPSYFEAFHYEDPSMPAEGRLAASFLRVGTRYEVTAATDAPGYDFTLERADGKAIDLVFSAAGAPTTLTQGGQPVPAVGTLAGLSSTSSAYFFDPIAKQVTVHLVGMASASSISMAGAFLANPFAGNAAVALPAGAVDGFTVSRFKGAGASRLRYFVPSGVPTSSFAVNTPIVDKTTSTTALVGSGFAPGDAAVAQGFFFAPDDGMYRLAFWSDGGGGGSAAYVGNQWVMGEPYAYLNSNWVTNGALTTTVSSFMPNGEISLRAGWHPFTILVSKDATGSTGPGEMHLRLALPSKPDTWVYAQVKRKP